MVAIFPPGIDAGQLDAAISSCRGDNPCEAAWQASYAYAADQSYKLAIFQALQGVAFGLMQYASADRTADQQYDIANRQMVIAEEEYARYKAVYVECEDNLAREICALVTPPVDYATRADRALRDVRREFTITRSKLERSRARYCMSDQLRAECNLDKAEALAVIMARDTAYRYAEKYNDFLDERRWSRRVVILQHGRNIMAGQSATYDSGSAMAAQALDNGQQAFANLLGTISGAVGSVGNAYSARSGAFRSFSQANINSGVGNSLITGGVPGPGNMSTNTGMVSGFRP
jgi:hypothetical protein